MRKAVPILVLLGSLAVAGCDDSTEPRDVTPPTTPRGLFSVTGDRQVKLQWLANTEGDLAGYRVYESPCADGPNCPYDRIGVTDATQFVATGQSNGITMHYAVTAVDRAGNESELSLQDVNDTPRPAGSTTLNNSVATTANAGWDFSAFTRLDAAAPTVDIVYGDNGSVAEMFATSVEAQPGQFFNNDIQDAGYGDLDAVDASPEGDGAGWSPTGTVELIPGHCYVVWTWDNHYAKFRVTGLNPSIVSLDWAYQTDEGNTQLLKHRVHTANPSPRAVAWLR